MASNMSKSVANYTSIASIKEFWLNEIAPKYFDMDETNNYVSGIYGFVNEVMANIVEDTQFSINMARREFYPSSAQFIRSLYKLAIPHNIDLPMATPAKFKTIILVREKDIVDNPNVQVEGNTKIMTLSSNMILMADNIPFMSDYPIKIIAKNKGNNTYAYTVHYDFTYNNTLSKINDKYLYNKSATYKGNEKYLLISLPVTQVSKTTTEEIITKNSVLETYTVDLQYDGVIASFEAFYQETDNSPKIQLIKQVAGSLPNTDPFINYTLLDNNTLRLSIPYNLYFNPAFNSSLTVDIYTTLGEEGNFDTYNGDIICDFSQCDDFPYNKELTIMGVSQGSSLGGKNKPTTEEFRQKVINAYSTDKTIVTENDLQILFNEIADKNNKLIFTKRRDDILYRLFGAFMLVRDKNNNIVPTNTCNLHLTEEHVNDSMVNDTMFTIKPGTIFTYDENNKNIVINKDYNIIDNLDNYEYGDNFKFIYSTPYLISGCLNPNLVGYYLNSSNQVVPLSYKYVNDGSTLQFIANNLYVERNALLGENFYKISLFVSPSSDLITTSDIFSIEEDIITAEDDGVILPTKHVDGDILMSAKYNNGDILTIKINNTVSNTSSGFKYDTGYTPALKVGDRFKSGSILASKKITDNGSVRLIGIFNGYLSDLGYYIPFVLDSYYPENNYYKFSAYIEIDDTVSINNKTHIVYGLYDKQGNVITEPMDIDIEDNSLNINLFYHDNELNLPHKYDSYSYVSNYTLTNEYSQTKINYFSLITPIKFVRSYLSFSDPTHVTDDSYITISEVPVVKANWIKIEDNCKYFCEKLLNNYLFIDNVFYSLEEAFSADFKFYNTYGVSKYYNVGVDQHVEPLNHVNCTFSFGVKLNSTYDSTDTFIDNFKTFVRNYIESINSDTNISNSIYIINLCTELKNSFDEIEYIEYYGMNMDYYIINDERNYQIQRIEAISTTELFNNGKKDYIPEFINVFSVQKDGVSTQKIDVSIL